MSEYAERDPMELEPHYSRHVSAMTGEQLHSKADIAAELAWRDQQIAKLREERDALASRHCDPIKTLARQIDAQTFADIEQERDALAATVDFLRKGMDGMGKHNASVKWHLDKAQDPAAILAARDARVRSEALREYGKHKDFCQAHKGEVCNCGLLYAIDKGGS